MNVRLYVEGGGDSKELRIACREGFSKLWRKAGFEGRMPLIVACGSRLKAYDMFSTAVAQADNIPVLLVDSEEPVIATSGWEHLRTRDGWEHQESTTEENVHLMVTTMETWMVADWEALRAVFGTCLHETALPPLHELELRPRSQVLHSLEKATEACGLSPHALWHHLPHFRRLTDSLNRLV